MKTRELTAQEIKDNLYRLADVDLNVLMDYLKNAEKISSELLAIQRGRNIHSNLENAIETLKDVQEHLLDYPITREVYDKVIPG